MSASNLSPDEVATLQWQLRILAYYAGALHGVLDVPLRDALARFQKSRDVGAKPGVIDEKTREELERLAVGVLRQQLKLLGYYDAELARTPLDDGTRAAVAEFKKREGLRAKPRLIDGKTLEALKRGASSHEVATLQLQLRLTRATPGDPPY